MSLTDKIYSKLPVWAQHLAVTGFGLYWHWLRFGPGYDSALKGYIEREKMKRLDWQRWQAERLKDVLKVALTTSYYSRTWDSAQKKAAQSGCLQELPLLEKEPLRSCPKDFIRRDIKPLRTLTFYTSGSTGTPIASIWTVSELRDSLALREARSARWAGVSFSMPRATFSGRMVEPNPNSKGPFYRYNAIEKQVYFSPFHIRPDTAKQYIYALDRHHIQWGTGYAVSFYILARLIKEFKLAVKKLKAIITTSEKLTIEMRNIMEEVYGCRIYEEYSTVENVLFASECEKGRLHLSPDVAIVEILRPDGTLCDLGEVGEVVATCLCRTYQPLIRFKIGDLAMWDPEPCPCGREMPIIKEVIGRIEDIIVTPDGRKMVRFHGIFINQPNIVEGQIIQESLNKIRVKVVPTPKFNISDKNEIIHRVQQRVGNNVNVVVELVDKIPRTKAGKFKAVVSLLKD